MIGVRNLGALLETDVTQLALSTPDRPMRFAFSWRGRPWRARLGLDPNGVDLFLTTVVGPLPFSGEDRAARAAWVKKLAAEAAAPARRRALALGRNGMILARWSTLLPKQADPADVLQALALCAFDLEARLQAP